MRQAGVLAAAGLVALRDHVDRLADDHARGPATGRGGRRGRRRLPDQLRGVRARRRRSGSSSSSAPTACWPARSRRGTVRLMTHLDVDDAGIERALVALKAAGVVRLTEVPGPRALAIFAHPDDPEVACAGTLACLGGGGCEAHVLIVNAGDKGSDDPGADPAALAAHRAAEVRAAGDVLGLAGHEMLGMPDGEAENDERAARAGLSAAIRACAARGRDLRPTRRPCSSASPTSTTTTTARSGGPPSTPARRWPAHPLYFPEAGPAHRSPTCCWPAPSSPTAGSRSATRSTRKARGLGVPRERSSATTLHSWPRSCGPGPRKPPRRPPPPAPPASPSPKAFGD